MAEKKTVKKKRKMSSAEKQAKQTLARRRRNQSALSRIRGTTKSVQGAGPGAKGLLPQAYSEIDRAAKRGVIHKRTAARRKARLARLAK